jgi:hypothetical protein
MGFYDNDHGLFTFPEFKNRGIIKLAPDALTFISGNFGTSVVAPVSGGTQKVDFRDGISSITVQNNVDPPGTSTASIEIIAPIYNDKSRYWVDFKGFDGRLYRRNYFVPMMEVKIFFKGRYLVGSGSGAQPQYYPAFWGFINSVEENFSGGTYKITLNCVDMLAWWGRVQVAFKPSVESDVFTGNLQGLTAYGSRYTTMNAFEIVYALVTEMGYENFITPDWLGKVTPSANIFSRTEMKVIWGGILDYWKKRWQGLVTGDVNAPNRQGNLRSGVNILKMYGAAGQLINDPNQPPSTLPPDVQKFQSDKDCTNKAKEASKSHPAFAFGKLDKYIKEFQVFHEFETMGSMDQADYQDKIQIVTEVKNRVEYEFYQDVNGNFIFKPPFYNLNVKTLMPYRIKPDDILSYSFGVNSDEITTCLEVQTGIQMNIRDQGWVNAVGYHIDMDLAKKYGHRFKKISLWYMSESPLTKALAVGHLTLQNVKAYTGNISMPGRPEIKLGYPIYVEHRDSFHYVKSINHSFDYGGSFTTTLSLEGERAIAYDYDPEENKFSVSKNMVYKLQIPYDLTPDKSLDKTKTTAQQKEKDKGNANKKLSELYKGAGFVTAMGTGRYAIRPGTVDEQSITPTTVPYSDEEGYRVIGSYKYGRGIIVKAGSVVGADLPPDDGQTAEQTALLRQSQLITNMTTVADEESSVMGTYFGVNKQTIKGDANPDGIENLIPPYLELDKEFYKGQATTDITISYTKDEEIIKQMSIQGSNYVGGSPKVISSQAGQVSSETISKNNEKIKKQGAL